LAPSDGELDEAATWVLTQDASPLFPRFVSEVLDDIRSHRR
jgi:hypothetical protein